MPLGSTTTNRNQQGEHQTTEESHETYAEAYEEVGEQPKERREHEEERQVSQELGQIVRGQAISARHSFSEDHRAFLRDFNSSQSEEDHQQRDQRRRVHSKTALKAGWNIATKLIAKK